MKKSEVHFPEFWTPERAPDVWPGTIEDCSTVLVTNHNEIIRRRGPAWNPCWRKFTHVDQEKAAKKEAKPQIEKAYVEAAKDQITTDLKAMVFGAS